MPDLSIVVAVAALGVSLATFWRSELRGTRVRCMRVPQSAYVGIAPTSEGLVVNVVRGLILVNDGPRPAYVSEIKCSSDASILGSSSVRVGLVEGGAPPVPLTRLHAVVQRDTRVMANVAWWLTVPAGQEEAVRAAVKDHHGPFWMDVEWVVLESFLVWPRFKKRKVRVRPIDRKGELVSWGTLARS
jgi:hypothetical protein